MSCVHGELKLDLALAEVNLALRVSCTSCAAQSFVREANGSRYVLDHKEWARHGPWRAGLRMGDDKFDVRLHVLDTEQDVGMRDIPLDRAIGFRVEPYVDGGKNRDKPRILVDVTSWRCHHTAYLKVIPFPAHEYMVCTNCWTGCALPDANNPNVKRELYVLRTHIVGALWWQDSAGSGARSTSAATIARLRRTMDSKEKLVWEIADTEDNDLKLDREGNPILVRGSPKLSPPSSELFNFGGRRFGKLS